MKSNVHIRQNIPNWLSIALALLFSSVEENKKAATKRPAKKKVDKSA